MDEGKISTFLARLDRNARDEGDTLAADAADLIRSLRTECDNQATRIVDLEDALEPFAAVAEAVFEKYETSPGQFRESYSDRPDEQEVWGFNRTFLAYGHLRAARAILAKVKG